MLDSTKFTEDQWREILDRATYYAYKRFKEIGLTCDGSAEPAVNAKTPPDIAADAICDILEGRRTCDPKYLADVSAFVSVVEGVIRSKISHLFGSSEYAIKRSIPTIIDDQGNETETDYVGKESSPVTLAIDRELEHKILTELAKEDDSLLKSMFECFDAGISKPADIAEVLGISVEEVNKAKKRYKRRMKPFLRA